MRGLLGRLSDLFYELTPDEVYALQNSRYANTKVVAHLTKIYMVIVFAAALVLGFCCRSLYNQDGSAALVNAFVLSWAPIFLLAIILGAVYPHLRRLQIPTLQRGAMIGAMAAVGLALGYQRFEPGTLFLYSVPFLVVPLIIWGAALITRSVLGRH